MVAGTARGTQVRDGWQPWRPGERPALPGLPRVIGHRGAAARAPENTLAGIRKARELGAAWVEFDVMLTRDGVPVLIHDETLGRTTSGRGRVADRTLAELRELDAGRWFAPSFAGERVPTLEEAVALLLELGLGANVEVKPSAGHEAATGEATTGLLARLWPPDGPGLLVSSFSRASLAAAAGAAPGIPRGLLAGRLPADWPAALTGLGCATLHLGQRWLRAAQLELLRGQGVPVLAYTVNRAARARDLLDGGRGVAAVFTDVPDTLLAALGGEGGQ
jgi:glycerophosphoryl diester phosphodiesterase